MLVWHKSNYANWCGTRLAAGTGYGTCVISRTYHTKNALRSICFNLDISITIPIHDVILHQEHRSNPKLKKVDTLHCRISCLFLRVSKSRLRRINQMFEVEPLPQDKVLFGAWCLGFRVKGEGLAS